MSVEAYLEQKPLIIKKFAVNPVDTGSCNVQIALLTSRISYLTEHVKQNHNDRDARYHLLLLIAKRNKLLKYLKSNKVEEYNKITEALGIRKK